MSDNKEKCLWLLRYGIDGYVHYKQASDQSFHEDNGVTERACKSKPPQGTRNYKTRKPARMNERPCPIHTIFT